jgi:hypothetical protein
MSRLDDEVRQDTRYGIDDTRLSSPQTPSLPIVKSRVSVMTDGSRPASVEEFGVDAAEQLLTGEVTAQVLAEQRVDALVLVYRERGRVGADQYLG